MGKWAIYEGEWKKNIREGQGKYNYTNGDIYNGEWKNDKIAGNGTMYDEKTKKKYKYVNGKKKFMFGK